MADEKDLDQQTFSSPAAYGGLNGPVNQGALGVDMPEMPENGPLLTELGAPGPAIMAGIITGEEPNPDLYWRYATRTYDKMRRGDSQVKAILNAMEAPLRSADYKVQPASDDPDHIDQASLIETALFHEIDGTWDDVMHHAYMMFWAGYSVLEKVWKVADDGTVYFQKFAPRPPKTIWRWIIGPDNELEGITQWSFKDYNYSFFDIPAEKLLIFTNGREGNNYEGISELRGMYQAWYYKQQLMKLMAIGYERSHVGIPTITIPDNNEAQKKQAAKIGRNMRSNEASYVVLPPGWHVNWAQAGHHEGKGTSILEAITMMDIAMARSVQAQQIMLGATDSGSYALSSDQSGQFLNGLQHRGKAVCQVFNQDAIPQLVKFNWKEDPKIYPKLVMSDLNSFDFAAVATAASELLHFGGLTPGPDLEDYLRSTMGIPLAPRNAVEATVGKGDKGDKDNGDAKNSNNSKGNGAGSTVADVAASDVPDIYKSKYLSLSDPRRRLIFKRMAQEQHMMATPYVVTLNRRDATHPDYRHRKAQTQRQLKTNFNRLGRDLEKAVSAE